MIRVVSIPMRTRFRGITAREAVLVEGAAGWGEWSPFLEYPPEVAEPWLRCAEEAAAGDWPEPLRDRVPVNVTVPAVGPERAHQIVAGAGCATGRWGAAATVRVGGATRAGVGSAGAPLKVSMAATLSGSIASTSTPSLQGRVDRITASSPKAWRTCTRASREFFATKRLTFMRHLR